MGIASRTRKSVFFLKLPVRKWVPSYYGMRLHFARCGTGWFQYPVAYSAAVIATVSLGKKSDRRHDRIGHIVCPSLGLVFCNTKPISTLEMQAIEHAVYDYVRMYDLEAQVAAVFPK